jgi:hypothetical protein
MKFLAYILMILIFFSCEPLHKKKHDRYSIKIVINSNYLEYIDLPMVSKVYDDSLYYDSVNNQSIYYFDSLKDKEVPVTIFSILTDGYHEIIHLNKDTTILFDTSQLAGFQTGDPGKMKSLSSTPFDTIYIGQKLVGCFVGYTEKVIIVNQHEKYKITYQENGRRGFDTTMYIPNSLFSPYFSLFISEARKQLPVTSKEGSFPFRLSTTSKKIYIRKGNDVYALLDDDEWKGYDKFKKSLGIRGGS